jgi:type IV fimbrial biogenesis protein FimT
MRRAVQGFTLVEMLVGLGLTVFFMLMTLPSASAYLTDARIRAAAQTYYSGAQLARAEAVRRNAEVRLLLTDDPSASPPTTSVNALGWVTLAGGLQGVDWSTLEGTEWVDSKDPKESRTTGLRVAANEAVVQFNGQGAASVKQIVKFLGPAADTCYPQGPRRCLHVVISLGGQVRLCDPGISNNGDNRKC